MLERHLESEPTLQERLMYLAQQVNETNEKSEGKAADVQNSQ
jgi:hypothetical protein